MDIDKILAKAFTDTDLANGGMLNPEQAAKFVQGIVDKAVIINECRREPMKAKKKQIDKITYTGDVLQKPEAVGTEHTTTTKPTTSKVELDSAEVLVAVDIGYDALEDSIEGKGLMDTIMELTETKVAIELDHLLLYGDKSGATGTVLDQIDGYFKQCTSHQYDGQTTTQMSPDVTFAMLKLLPGKYMSDEANWRFYVSHLARLDYIKALADEGVNEAFVRYILEANEPTYQGITVRKLGAIDTEDFGGGVYGSKAALVNPKNIVLGIHRDIMTEMERKPRKRVVEVTMTMRLDMKLEEEDAAVEAIGIKHSA